MHPKHQPPSKTTAIVRRLSALQKSSYNFTHSAKPFLSVIFLCFEVCVGVVVRFIQAPHSKALVQPLRSNTYTEFERDACL